MPSNEENIAMMHRLVFEIQQDAKYSLIPTLVAPNFVNHTAEAGLPNDISGVAMVMQYIHAAFSDIKMQIDSCICDNDLIATNKVLTGKHVGEFMGVKGEGEKKRVRIMDFVKVDGEGRIVEHWACIRPAELVEE
jgi:predicted ester cyclase